METVKLPRDSSLLSAANKLPVEHRELINFSRFGNSRFVDYGFRENLALSLPLTMTMLNSPVSPAQKVVCLCLVSIFKMNLIAGVPEWG